MTYRAKLEQISIAILTILFFAIVYKYYTLAYYSAGADSAGFVCIISSVHDGKGMISSAFSSIYSLIPYLTYNLEQYMNADFLSLHHSQDFSQWHAYLIVYFMAFFKYIGLSSLQIASSFMSLTITGSLLIIYVFLRSNKVNIVFTILFIVSILFYLPFIGHIFGQFYFDRFFVFFELLLLVLLYQELENDYKLDKYIILVFLFTMSISERPALFASLTIIYFIMIYWKKVSFKKDLYLFILPIIGFIYIYIYMKFVLDSPYYSKITIDSIVVTFNQSFDFGSLIGQKTQIFLLILLPMLIISAMNYKFFILSLITILPNLIVSIGGAEKVGFTTHYHSMYIPFLLFSTAIGIIYINKIKNNIKRYILLTMSILFIYSTYHIKLLDLKAKTYMPDLNILAVSPISNTMISFNANKIFYNKLISDLPHDAKISTLEWIMPALSEYGMDRIDYFPIGIRDYEFLLVESFGTDNTTIPSVPSYLSDTQEKKEIAKYLQNIINKDYKIFKSMQGYGRKFIIYQKKDYKI
jgi:hypothetical protein